MHKEQVRAKRSAADGKRMDMQRCYRSATDIIPLTVAPPAVPARLLSASSAAREFATLREKETFWFDALVICNDMIFPGMRTKRTQGRLGGKLRGAVWGYVP